MGPKSKKESSSVSQVKMKVSVGYVLIWSSGFSSKLNQIVSKSQLLHYETKASDFLMTVNQGPSQLLDAILCSLPWGFLHNQQFSPCRPAESLWLQIVPTFFEVSSHYRPGPPRIISLLIIPKLTVQDLNLICTIPSVVQCNIITRTLLFFATLL